MNEYTDITPRALRDDRGFYITAQDADGELVFLVDSEDKEEEASFIRWPEHGLDNPFLLVQFDTRENAEAVAEDWRRLVARDNG